MQITRDIINQSIVLLFGKNSAMRDDFFVFVLLFLRDSSALRVRSV